MAANCADSAVKNNVKGVNTALYLLNYRKNAGSL